MYLDGNTAGSNTIAGFVRHADGSLTALPGSPFAAGGAGLGASIGSQGAIQFTDHGRYLLAVDAGSNQISVLRISGDGSLSPGCRQSFRLWRSRAQQHRRPRRLVYVSNLGSASTVSVPNYTGFSLERGGQLQPIPNSTVTVAGRPGARRRPVQQRRHEAGRGGGRPDEPARSQIDSFRVNLERNADRCAGITVSRRKALARSAASSARSTRTSCSCPTPTTAPGSARCRRSTTPGTAHCRRSAPRRSPTTRPPRAGWWSATTANTSTRSTPDRQASPATRSPVTERSRCIGSTPLNGRRWRHRHGHALSTDDSTLYVNEARHPHRRRVRGRRRHRDPTAGLAVLDAAPARDRGHRGPVGRRRVRQQPHHRRWDTPSHLPVRPRRVRHVCDWAALNRKQDARPTQTLSGDDTQLVWRHR